MYEYLYELCRDESGQDLAEYSLLLALIGLVVIVAVQQLAPGISSAFSQTTSAFGSGS